MGVCQMSLIDYGKLEGQAGQGRRERFRIAEPFPHTVVEDILLGDSDELAQAFPAPSWQGWASRTSSYQSGKSSCRDIDVMPRAMRDLILELSGPRFLRALASMTSIDALFPDPFLHGGGLMCMDPGGVLTPHTDRQYHPTLRLFRRVNVLVYLNRDWDASEGGEFSLFDFGGERPALTVPPRFGTCVIFATDHRSVHGVQPLTGSSDGVRSRLLLLVDPADVFESSPPDSVVPHEDAEGARPCRAGETDDGMDRAQGGQGATHAAYRVDPQTRQLV